MFNLNIIGKINLKPFAVFYLFVFLIISCKDDLGVPIEIVLPKETAKLVVSSLFSPWDSTGVKPFYVEVLRSTSIYDTTAEESVKDANVLLFKDGALLDTLHFDTLARQYLCMHSPKISSEYSIRVSKKGFRTVNANDYVPQKVKIDNFSVIPYAGKDDSSWSSEHGAVGVFSKVNIEFTDPANTTNYYEIALKIKEGKEFVRIYTYEDIIKNEAYYPSALSLELKKPFYLPFKDNKINGKTLSIDVFYYAPMWEDASVYIASHTIQMHLRSVTEEYYKYHTSLLQHFYKQKDDIIFGMAEPLNAYTNIENGYGVFAGYNEDVVELHIDEMKIE